MFRYASKALDLRRALIRGCALLQGKTVVFLQDSPQDITRVLENSNRKGDFLERLIALPAWDPVQSIESSDGENWQELLHCFKQIMRQAHRQGDLAAITAEQVRRLASSSPVITGESIARVCAQSFFRWLFCRPLGPEEEELYYQASLEWRKEIALKGRASAKIKSEFWSSLRATYRSSVFADLCQPAEGRTSKAALPFEEVAISALAQPFLLSPQINFSDVMATLFTHVHAQPQLAAALQKDFSQDPSVERPEDSSLQEGYILEAIRLAHPFPMLERELCSELTLSDGRHLQAGTQVMIPLDEISPEPESLQPERWLRKNLGQNPHQSIPFGAGERRCPGKALALSSMRSMITALIQNWPLQSIRPFENHLFSGRLNDGRDPFLASQWHQLKTACRVLHWSYSIGRKGKTQKKPGS